LEKKQPDRQGEKNRQAKINKGRRAQIRVNLKANKKLSRDQSESETDHDANYPCGKVGAENINRWRMGIRSATCQQQIAGQ
jgi:hypothetical protein